MPGVSSSSGLSANGEPIQLPFESSKLFLHRATTFWDSGMEVKYGISLTFSGYQNWRGHASGNRCSNYITLDLLCADLYRSSLNRLACGAVESRRNPNPLRVLRLKQLKGYGAQALSFELWRVDVETWNAVASARVSPTHFTSIRG